MEDLVMVIQQQSLIDWIIILSIAGLIGVGGSMFLTSPTKSGMSWMMLGIGILAIVTFISKNLGIIVITIIIAMTLSVLLGTFNLLRRLYRKK